MPVLIHPAGSARRMSTGTERGGIRMTFQGLPGPNSTLTLLHEGSYTPAGAVGFLILSLLACWPVGLLACWPVGLLACWPVGLLACWPVGLLACWPVGLLACWPVGLLACWEEIHHAKHRADPDPQVVVAVAQLSIKALLPTTE